MNTDRLRIGTVALACAPLLLAGCASYGNLDGAYDPDAFGEANRQTYAAMIVNPEPEYDTDMTTSAEKTNAAIDRYRNDAVKQPDSIESTSTPGGGGGGGG